MAARGRAKGRGSRLLLVSAVVLWAGVVLLVVGVAAARLFGWQLNAVETSSMDPGIPAGSLALISPVASAELSRGDVVSFRWPRDRRERVLHRIERVIQRSEGRFFETKGDANDRVDPYLVPEGDVLGVERWHVSHLGSVVRRLAPPWGYAILGGAPALLLAAHEIRRLRRRRPAEARMVAVPALRLPRGEEASVEVVLDTDPPIRVRVEVSVDRAGATGALRTVPPAPRPPRFARSREAR